MLAICLAPSWPKLANIDSLLLWSVCSAAHLERIRSVERDEISPKANTLRSVEHIASAHRKSAEHRVFQVLSFLSSVSGFCAVVSSWPYQKVFMIWSSLPSRSLVTYATLSSRVACDSKKDREVGRCFEGPSGQWTMMDDVLLSCRSRD